MGEASNRRIGFEGIIVENSGGPDPNLSFLNLLRERELPPSLLVRVHAVMRGRAREGGKADSRNLSHNFILEFDFRGYGRPLVLVEGHTLKGGWLMESLSGLCDTVQK